MCQGAIKQVSQHCVCDDTNGEVAYVYFPLLLVRQGQIATCQSLWQHSVVYVVGAVYYKFFRKEAYLLLKQHLLS